MLSFRALPGTLAVTGDTTLNGNVTANGSLTVTKNLVAKSKIGINIKTSDPIAELDVEGDIKATGAITAGSVTITNGLIQKGTPLLATSEIPDGNPDLGIYSQEPGRSIRFVTTNSDFYFSSAGKYGKPNDPTLKIDKDGNLTAKGTIKGKIWHSTEYEVEGGSSGQQGTSSGSRSIGMLPTKNSVAFLTHIQGSFAGEGEGIWIGKVWDDQTKEEIWTLNVQYGSYNGVIRGKAICIGSD